MVWKTNIGLKEPLLQRQLSDSESEDIEMEDLKEKDPLPFSINSEAI